MQFQTETVGQRLALYKDMLVRAEAGEFDVEYGFCFVLDKHYHIYTYDRLQVGDRFENYLPELYTQKPNTERESGHWFQSFDWAPRIKCLKRAIELCEKILLTSSITTNETV